LECFYNSSRPGDYCKQCMRAYQRGRAKRKRPDAESDSEPDSDTETPDTRADTGADTGEADTDPPGTDPAPSERAPDLYIFANSLLPGLVKIGRSKDVERRRSELQRSQPFRIVTVASFPGSGHLEAKVHLALHAHLVDGPGREWFSIAASDAIHAIAIAMR
jgi:hypothetical protein